MLVRLHGRAGASCVAVRRALGRTSIPLEPAHPVDGGREDDCLEGDVQYFNTALQRAQHVTSGLSSLQLVCLGFSRTHQPSHHEFG